MVERSNICFNVAVYMSGFPERFDPSYDCQFIALDIPDIWVGIL